MTELESISKTLEGEAAVSVDKAAYRGARKICKACAPDLFFGLNQLPRIERYSSLIIHALFAQLAEIMGPVQADKETGSPDCDSPETCEESEACALASVCQSEKVCAGEGAGEDEVTNCDKGDACCEGESVAQRLDVCTSVLDHLFSDQPTGKPELDALTMVREAYGLPRSLFDDVVQGMATQRERARYQTWADLLDTLQQTSGAAAMLIARVNLGQVKSQAVLGDDDNEKNIRTWGVALQLIDVICNVGDDVRAGRVMLPLEALAKHDLTESEVKAFAVSRSGESDPRWKAMLADFGQRVAGMMGDAVSAMELLSNSSSRRALAGATLSYWQRLVRVAEGEVDVFDEPVKLSSWSRFRLLPRMARWAVDPTEAIRLLG
jgi:phytoene/squalene synthetase